MNQKNLLAVLIAFFLAAPLMAQHKSIDEIFGERGEIYFKFNRGQHSLDQLSRIISIDNVKGETVFAYANKQEMEAFLKYTDSFELLPKPGELLKNPKMLSEINVKEIDDWDFYPTYEGYLDMMNQFAANHPDICEVFSIGQTVEGRELMMAKISDNVGTREAEPQFLYTGTMHGDETTGYVLLLRLIDYLLENYGTDPRITNMVNNIEIWINPAANPDGTYAGGNSTVNGATRNNGNYVNLNRNYPDPEDGPHPDGYEWQPETVAFMQLAEEEHFVMSANLHGGTEVLNYPWDTWSTLTADNDWWVYVSREYADTVHLYSPANYMNEYNDGITNGYQWYSIDGGRQDYMNYFHQCREETMELSDVKLLSPSELPDHWEWNYRSMLNYIEQCTYGVSGVVTDAETGDPLPAMVFIDGHDMDSSMVFSEPTTGFYQRMLNEGTYDITFSAPGKYPVTIEDVVVTKYNTVNLDVELDAGSLIADFTASSTSVSIGGSVSFTDLSYGNPVAWLWTFEGATPSSSTEQNPSGITWDETGTYDVSLMITDGDGNTETMAKEDYISVNAEFYMGNETITTCTGLFFDTGGESGDYSNDEDFTMTFLPGTAGSNIIVDFETFDVEDDADCDYDWLKIYDGSSTSAPLIDVYCGTGSPGTIEATNDDGALTFEFHSDYSVTRAGWKAMISCSTPPLLPVADFTADTTHIHQGESIHFTDLSTNNPTSWAWVFEGGTPGTSSEQNPTVSYEIPGDYNVTLIVQNENGSDSMTIEDFIIVDSTIGMAELLQTSIRVYPNPLDSENLLHISADKPIESYMLVDYTGKVLESESVDNAGFEIDMTGRKTGIYLVKLNVAGNWITRKVNLIK